MTMAKEGQLLKKAAKNITQKEAVGGFFFAMMSGSHLCDEDVAWLGARRLEMT